MLGTDRLERGSLVHRILEAFVRPQIGRPVDQDADGLFSVGRLLAIAEAEMATFEADGLSGPRTPWRVEQVRIRRELRAFAAADRRWRAAHGAVTTGVEQDFGFDGTGPVVVTPPGRQPVRFRGKVDRVDALADGTVVVTDYKTGSTTGYRDVENDHFQGGRTLQLAVYGLALGASTLNPVMSQYWFVSEKGGFGRLGYALTPDEVAHFEEVVDVLSDALARGHFPATPGKSGAGRLDPCTFCPYDAVCPVDRQQVWNRSREDPALARFVELSAE
jgi:RecB family exonuclease